MRCEEFREKFVNDELNDDEKSQFKEHLKVCLSCRTFVQNYQKVRENLKLIYVFKPSSALGEGILSKIHRKESIKKGLIFGLPGVAAVAISMVMVFYIFGSSASSNFAYDKAVSAGISLLKSQPSTTLTYAETGNSNLNYLLKIKYVSDQF